MNTATDLLALLSRREREVLALIGAGHARSQIATAMGISRATVEIYCNRIMVKLGIYDLAGLALYGGGAVKSGLISQ
jgi:DNA-binding NarL/FixJ family response regulator